MSAGVAALMVIIPDLMSPGLLGLALTLSLGMIQSLSFLSQLSTEVQGMMNSVERIKYYEEGGGVDQEVKASAADGGAILQPSSDWPSKGNIEFQELAMVATKLFSASQLSS